MPNCHECEVKPYTPITGASTGLGKAFAIQCAKKSMNLILVSLPGEGLVELCRQIAETHQVKVVPFEADLTENESVQQLVNWVLSNFRVNFLINNVGIGGSHMFKDVSVASLEKMIRLNIGVTSLLTRHLIRELKSHPKAYILNVSSVIAFHPAAYKTVYPASKAFIYYFSRGLFQEMRGSGLHVSVILPGPFATNASVSQRIKKQGLWGKILLLTPEKVAEIAIVKTLKKQSVIIPGLGNKMSWLLMTVFPTRILLSFISKRFSTEIESTPDPEENYISNLSHEKS